MIEFRNVKKIYTGGINTVALDDISFIIEKEEFVSLVGHSGAGKSTLLKLLNAEEKPTSGEIFFNGEDIAQLTPKQLPYHRRRIGTVFQDFKLLPRKTLFENVAFALEVSDHSDKEIRELVPQILEIVGLAHKMDSYPREISGGEQQRVAIARALGPPAAAHHCRRADRKSRPDQQLGNHPIAPQNQQAGHDCSLGHPQQRHRQSRQKTRYHP